MSTLSTSTVLMRGFRCRCPRCGKGRLFAGLLSYSDACDICGLDYGTINADDGPAAFVIFFVMVIVLPPVIWFHFTFSPAWWVHVLVWTPIVTAMTIAMLRPSKALLSGFKFAHGTE